MAAPWLTVVLLSSTTRWRRALGWWPFCVSRANRACATVPRYNGCSGAGWFRREKEEQEGEWIEAVLQKRSCSVLFKRHAGAVSASALAAAAAPATPSLLACVRVCVGVWAVCASSWKKYDSDVVDDSVEG